jgi:DNA-binding NtrC family response regulator
VNAQPPSSSPHYQLPRAPGRRVLIVDDEPRLRDMLTRSTREMGYEPVSARSAEQAAKVLEQDGFDAMILDLNLPGMNGLEFLARVRSRWPDLQVIILTGYGDLEAARKAIRLDAVDFLTKPCLLDDLEVALSRAQQRRRTLHQLALRATDGSDELGGDEPSTATPPTLEQIEQRHILAALERNHGNRAATAAQLGISERTLYYRLGQYCREGQLRPQ